jgi:hypothetical protein
MVDGSLAFLADCIAVLLFTIDIENYFLFLYFYLYTKQ